MMKSKLLSHIVSFVICAFSVSALVDATTRKAGDVTESRLRALKGESQNWFTGGRDWRQSYYSPLSQIRKENVRSLGFAWDYRFDSSSAREPQATPLVVDGVMFTSGSGGAVHALDARTGTSRWSFVPKIDEELLRKHCCGGVNRGVAVWRGKVYVATVDGYLYALDAGNGVVVWKADTIIDRSRAYSSTGAPYIAKERVIIGNSGAEYSARGYITAYDVETGKQAWRFFIVPGDPKKGFEHPELEMAARTWDPNSLWDFGLGGTAWDGMAYDPKLNLLYVGTGNGLPWNRKLRSPAGGDNLFLSCILAINPDTGRLVWHYQTTPGENWDFTATQKMVLADLKIEGRLRKVILQAPKNGFFYVLDRATGELLSAKSYVYMNWASQVDLKTGRPVETGKGDYSQAPKLVFPQDRGGHNWHPMAYNPGTGLVYIPTLMAGSIYAMPTLPLKFHDYQWNYGVKYRGWDPADLSSGVGAGEPDPQSRTFLKAWDPVKQTAAWEVETTGANHSRELGGVMTTAGDLVFQGRPAGEFVVLDAKSGHQLHRIDTGDRMAAAPMTYEVQGRQYVAIMTGVDRYKDRILAFTLDGGAVPKIPKADPSAGPPPVSPFGSPAQIQLGKELFERNCAVCHPARAPDLSKMTEATYGQFSDILLKGLRATKGMPNFSGVLSQEDVRPLLAYLTEVAWTNYRDSHGQTASQPHTSDDLLR